MNYITEWMIEKGIASHGIAAGHIFAGLKLEDLPRAEQESRCILYRAWRPKTDKKNQVPTKQAFDLAVAGIDPNEIMDRQMWLFAEASRSF